MGVGRNDELTMYFLIRHPSIQRFCYMFLYFGIHCFSSFLPPFFSSRTSFDSTVSRQYDMPRKTHSKIKFMVDNPMTTQWLNGIVYKNLCAMFVCFSAFFAMTHKNCDFNKMKQEIYFTSLWSDVGWKKRPKKSTF